VVCRSVCHTSERCKNGCTDRDAVWVEDSGGPIGTMNQMGGSDPPWEGVIFLRGDGRPIVKYGDTVRTYVQKRLNRSRYRFGCGLGWAVGIMC